MRKDVSNSQRKQQKPNTPEIKVDLIKSDSAVTTRTFINEQVFLETEFLPTSAHPSKASTSSSATIASRVNTLDYTLNVAST